MTTYMVTCVHCEWVARVADLTEGIAVSAAHEIECARA